MKHEFSSIEKHLNTLLSLFTSDNHVRRRTNKVPGKEKGGALHALSGGGRDP